MDEATSGTGAFYRRRQQRAGKAEGSPATARKIAALISTHPAP